MACPYANGDVSLSADISSVVISPEEIQEGMNNLTVMESINYGKYLKLDKVLSSQTPLSSTEDGRSVHDEHLFIVTHQAYELWFKQILYEIDSVREILNEECVEEGKMLLIISRLNRVNQILKLLCDQFSILETMSPLDFLQFRTFLGASSGFQSLQFRLLENTLGIRDENRVRYNQQYYKDVFSDEKSTKLLDQSINKPSLLQLLERWLERTPGLSKDEFHFWNKYKAAIQGWLRNDWQIPAEEEKDPQLAKLKMDEYKKIKDSFDTILSEEKYNTLISRGERRISYLAFQGAMMIYLYRDEPRFHQPYQMLTMLQDLDSHFTKWRYNHVVLVQRMIGSKLGTGGSSGYQYLRSTVSDRYKVFVDLFNLSTYIIPRSYIPSLSQRMKKTLSTMLRHPELLISSQMSASSGSLEGQNSKDEEESAQFTIGSLDL